MKGWRSYNQSLIRRGQILIDTAIAELEEPRSKKKGRPFKYPKALIFSALILKFLFKLPYRQLEGFLMSMFPNSNIPRFTTIHHRSLSMSHQI